MQLGSQLGHRQFDIVLGRQIRFAGRVTKCLGDSFGLGLRNTGLPQPVDEFERVE